ncbi:SoxR reducing system RseC family protein [Prevotella sp. AGR2160]|uniref:SoxR reducing system RseC family protein n=1 Tax=Prevotella sp. AGR2160 TaxID=1280674 RepID=UPI0006842146|nr:SoxR reducing system RseC family protein [Prevotella sp. AGR2160]
MNKQQNIEAPDCQGCQLSSRCHINREGPMQPRAIILAYVVPFLLVVAVLVAVIVLTGDEAAGALASLASLIPYYIILHILDRRKCLIEKSKN